MFLVEMLGGCDDIVMCFLKLWDSGVGFDRGREVQLNQYAKSA